MKRDDVWRALQRYPTEPGITTRVADNRAYVSALADSRAAESLGRIERAGVDVSQVVIYRLFVRGKLDVKRFSAGVAALTEGATRFAICQCRLSGSRNQQDGASGPQQEHDTVMEALLLGATHILVVCEAYSASAGSVRAVFPRLLDCMRRGTVRAWVVAQIDRITRAPKDAVAWVEAVEESCTEVYSPNHKGAVDPYQALMLTLVLIMGSLQVIAIRAGNLRGWKRRLDDGQWPNKAHLPPGIVLRENDRPEITPAARVAIAKLAQLIATGMDLKQAVAAVAAENPKWWTGASCHEDEPPSEARVARLLRTTALVDGKQKFAYRNEQHEAVFPGLADVLDQPTFAAVQRALLPNVKEPRARMSAWQRFLADMRERGIPMHAVVEAGGGIEYDLDGNVRVYCRLCRTKGIEPPPPMQETDAFYTRLDAGLATANYAVPVFLCEGCSRTTRPVGLELMSQLLAGKRPVRCPRCGSTRLDSQVDTIPGLGRLARHRCTKCTLEFHFPARDAAPEERFRFFFPRKQGQPKPRGEADLRSFDTKEDE